MKAIISGATRGIGKAISIALAKRGYHLILLARSEKDLLELSKELKTNFSSCEVKCFALDLSLAESFEKLSEKLISLEKIDLLVNNVGLYEMNSALGIKREELQKQIEINLYSAIELTQVCLEKIEIAEAGLIVNIGSIMSLKSAPFASNYSISKHAFKAWNDALRAELQEKRIKVTAFYPGAVNTSSWDGIDANREAMIQPEDIAQLVALLPQLSHSSLIEEIRIAPLQF